VVDRFAVALRNIREAADRLLAVDSLFQPAYEQIEALFPDGIGIGSDQIRANFLSSGSTEQHVITLESTRKCSVEIANARRRRTATTQLGDGREPDRGFVVAQRRVQYRIYRAFPVGDRKARVDLDEVSSFFWHQRFWIRQHASDRGARSSIVELSRWSGLERNLKRLDECWPSQGLG
jgi:hypothetical protein